MTEKRPADGSKYTSHACEDARLAEAEVDTCRRVIRRALGTSLKAGESLLDVGCGSSGDGAAIASPASYLGIDRDAAHMPQSTSSRHLYRRADLFDPGLPQFTVVLAKRVLCQLPERRHPEALRSLWRRVTPGGLLTLCEPIAEVRSQLDSARLSCGLRALPEPASGGHPLWWAAARQELGEPLTQAAVAPEYVVWTRFLSEVVTGRLPGYDEGWARICPFSLTKPFLALGFYRAAAWLKSH